MIVNNSTPLPPVFSRGTSAPSGTREEEPVLEENVVDNNFQSEKNESSLLALEFDAMIQEAIAEVGNIPSHYEETNPRWRRIIGVALFSLISFAAAGGLIWVGAHYFDLI